MKPPIEYRPTRIPPDEADGPLVGVARTKNITPAEAAEIYPPSAGHMGSPARKAWQKAKNDEFSALAELAHKRAVKAAQMRRYRAKRKAP